MVAVVVGTTVDARVLAVVEEGRCPSRRAHGRSSPAPPVSKRMAQRVLEGVQEVEGQEVPFVSRPDMALRWVHLHGWRLPVEVLQGAGEVVVEVEAGSHCFPLESCCKPSQRPSMCKAMELVVQVLVAVALVEGLFIKRRMHSASWMPASQSEFPASSVRCIRPTD